MFNLICKSCNNLDEITFFIFSIFWHGFGKSVLQCILRVDNHFLKHAQPVVLFNTTFYESMLIDLAYFFVKEVRVSLVSLKHWILLATIANCTKSGIFVDTSNLFLIFNCIFVFFLWLCSLNYKSGISPLNLLFMSNFTFFYKVL